MRPELRKTSYLRKLKAEIVKEAGGIDEDIKTALEDICLNVIDWRANGVRKDDLDTRTLGDIYTVDDSTDEVDGSPGTYQVPDGTSIVAINWEDIAAEVTLLQPDDAPSVILVVHEGDYMEKVLHWGSDTLSVCPMNLLIRAGADWMQVPLAWAFEHRMKNETFTITGEEGTVEVPPGTGAVVCDGLTDAVTLDLSGDFYPQLIFVNNTEGGHTVTFEGNTINAGGLAAFLNFGGTWLPLGGDE